MSGQNHRGAKNKTLHISFSIQRYCFSLLLLLYGSYLSGVRGITVTNLTFAQKYIQAGCDNKRHHIFGFV